jgi:hypothetical protein
MTPEQLTSARRDMKYGNLIENRHVERVFDSSRKETHWGRRKLARDR